MGYVKRALAKVGSAPAGNVPCQDERFIKQMPALGEFLTSTDAGDGKTRQTATLNVSWAAGAFVVFLNDRETDCSLCKRSDTLWGALAALDQELQSDEPGWRKKDNSTPQKKKRG